MAVKSNGRPVEPDLKDANGHAVAAKSKTPKAHQKKPKSAFVLLSIFTRILAWYSIFTILVQCPATADLLTDSSPKICKPYFQIKSFIAPHVEPYYDAYAAHYVDAARPYYDTLDRRIITPATALGKKYGGPRVAQAQAFGQAQWEKNFQPEVLKYQGIAKEKYDQTLAPHINKIATTCGPYFEVAKTNALQTYYGHILPAYATVQPYALQGYNLAYNFVANTGIPYTKWAWTTGGVFLDRTIFPRLRILYGENVEPQLVRIGERLGRYRDGKKLKAVVDEIDRSSTSQTTTTTQLSNFSAKATNPPSSSVSEVKSTVIPSTAIPEPTPLTEEELIANAQKIVAKDLRVWQEKFAKAADEGSDEIEERITEITDRLIKNQAQKVGPALVIELEETIKASLKNLQSTIIYIVHSYENAEDAEEALVTAVRKAGVAIREKGQAVRTWKQSFDKEAGNLISASVKDTFDILDHIADLGLQEIGMRWAWTDGITHKDWTKYHAMKGKFAEWRGDVEMVVHEHPGIEAALSASADVENKAMDIAEDAAKELARLKEVGLWKISAKDTSDDFSTKHIPAAAVVAGQQILDKASEISEAIAGTSQGTVESVTSIAVSSISEAISSASSIAYSQANAAQGIANNLGESATNLASSIPASVVGTSQGSVESIASVAKESAGSLVDQASSSVIGTSQGTIESVTSVAAESAKSVASAISDSASSLSDELSSSASSAVTSVTAVVSDASTAVSSSASSISSEASQKVWGGAMAQHVEAKQIIFDDIVEDPSEDSFSEKIQSMASDAGDKFAEVTKAVSEALLRPTSTQGVVESVTGLAAEQYSSALAAASSVLYGTEQGPGESIASVASSRYADAVSAARAAIYGTPTPVSESVLSHAKAAYDDAVSRASNSYSQAKSLVSAQVSGSPKPAHEELYSSAESAYSEAVRAANSRYQAVSSAASTAVYGPPTGAIESIQSLAASKLSEGLSAASAQYEQAKSLVGATPTPAAQNLLAQAQNQYYAGIGLAHARYSEFLSAVLPSTTPLHASLYSRASASIVGTPTPAYQAALAKASSYYDEALSSASSNLDEVLASVSSVGAAAPDALPTISLASAASSQYNSVVSEAAKSYSSFSSALASKNENLASSASSAIHGTETPWTESVASAASTNWDFLLTRASEQIYGSPTPVYITQNYFAQATDGAISQYSAVQSLVSELVSGKEPDFTESVYNRLSSAYYTGAPGAASYASEALGSATSFFAATFTPPPSLEEILSSAQGHINEALAFASQQIYPTETRGSYEQATSSLSSAYASISSAASEKVYGTQAGYVEAAQSSIAAAAEDAKLAMHALIFGTTTTQAGEWEKATSIAGEQYASATEKAKEQYKAAEDAVRDAVYGRKVGVWEEARGRLEDIIKQAKKSLEGLVESAGDGANGAYESVGEAVESVKSVVQEAVESASEKVRGKDEL